MKKFLVVLFISVLIFGMSNCSTNKHLINNDLNEISSKKLLKEIENNNFDFETFQAKLSVSFDSPDMNMTLKGQLRMEKDSIIWMSLSLPMGLEVARVMITEDSVFFLNKAEKKYLKEHLDSINKIIPFVNLQLVQSVLVGNDINIRNANYYDLKIDNGFYNLKIINKLKREIKNKDLIIKGVSRNIWITPDYFKIARYQINELTDETKNIQLKYSDFQLVGEKYLPSEIDVELNFNIVMKVRISYSNVIVNQPLEYKFSIPKKFLPMNK